MGPCPEGLDVLCRSLSGSSFNSLIHYPSSSSQIKLKIRNGEGCKVRVPQHPCAGWGQEPDVGLPTRHPQAPLPVQSCLAPAASPPALTAPTATFWLRAPRQGQLWWRKRRGWTKRRAPSWVCAAVMGKATKCRVTGLGWTPGAQTHSISLDKCLCLSTFASQYFCFAWGTKHWWAIME